MEFAGIYAGLAALILASIAYFFILRPILPRYTNHAPTRAVLLIFALFFIAIILILTFRVAAAEKSKGCTQNLAPLTLSDVVNDLMAAKPGEKKTYLLEGRSQEFTRQGFNELRALMKEKFGVNLRFKNLEDNNGWYAIHFEISGPREKLLPAIFSFCEYKDELSWLKD